MHEILKLLDSNARVLDLGCAAGSFDVGSTAARVVRVDREAPAEGTRDGFVRADASRLPFADGTFNFVVSNHSLEHFEDLPGSLTEIARVVRSQGALFVTVPDANTFCDKLYRWLARGGGHVNAFTSPSDLAATIEGATGLRHMKTRTLFTSLSFLNGRNSKPPRPRRLALIGGGREWSLFLFALVARSIDRRAGTRLSEYGWALYFGNISIEIDASSALNVCLRCGSGTASALLSEKGLVSRRFRWLKVYRCPQCGAENPFVEDSWPSPTAS